MRTPEDELFADPVTYVLKPRAWLWCQIMGCPGFGPKYLDIMDSHDSEIRRDTIEKAKDVVRAYADCYQPTDKMLADLDALIQEEETTGSTVDRSEELLNDIRSEIRKSWRKEDERRGSGEA